MGSGVSTNHINIKNDDLMNQFSLQNHFSQFYINNHSLKTINKRFPSKNHSDLSNKLYDMSEISSTDANFMCEEIFHFNEIEVIKMKHMKTLVSQEMEDDVSYFMNSLTHKLEDLNDEDMYNEVFVENEE